MLKNGVYFIVIAPLVAEVFPIWVMQIRRLVTSQCNHKVYRVEILQGCCAVRTTHFDFGYDVTIATYSSPDLYLPKMKTALFVAPEFNRLLVLALCNFHIHSHPLNEQQEQIRFLKEENSGFPL